MTLADVGQLRAGTVDVITDTTERITPAGVANSSAVVHPAGTVFLSRTASVGFSAVMGTPMAVSQDFMTWTPGRLLNRRFLLHVLRGMRPRLLGLMYGSTHKTIYMPDLLALRTPLPPIERQHEIVNFLDRECERVTGLIAAAATLSGAVRDADRSWVDSELDTHVATHARAKLGWFVRVIPGFAFPSSGFVTGVTEGTARLLRGINVGVGTTRWDETVRWRDDGSVDLRPWLLREGDLVMGMDRPWVKQGLRIATVQKEDLPALLLQRVACLRPVDDRLDARYLRLWLDRDLFQQELGHSLTGVAVPHVSGSQIEAFRIAVPPIEEQRRVIAESSRRSEVSKRLCASAASLADGLLAYRDALVTEAVTGHIDVSVVSDAQMDEQAHAAAEGALPVGRAPAQVA